MRAGCDLVDISRLSAKIDGNRGFLDRVFTAREIADARRGGVAPGSETERARLAARFAAKEAARKALGELRIPFHDTEVRTRADGAPELWIRGERSALTLSLSHDGGVALALVVGPSAPDPAPGPPVGTTQGATHAARR